MYFGFSFKMLFHDKITSFYSIFLIITFLRRISLVYMVHIYQQYQRKWFLCWKHASLLRCHPLQRPENCNLRSGSCIQTPALKPVKAQKHSQRKQIISIEGKKYKKKNENYKSEIQISLLELGFCSFLPSLEKLLAFPLFVA